MSLLLEALKKAELAKQGAVAPQPPAPSAAPPAAPTQETPLSLVEEERPEPVITRESLPNITQSLHIAAEDLPSAAAQRAPAEAAPSRAAAPEPPRARPEPELLRARPEPEPSRAMPVEPDVQPAREAARQLFDVKEVDYNPRKPFYITVGVLLACGLGYGGYVWWQMQPRYAVNTAAIQSAPKGPPPSAGVPAPQVDAGPQVAQVAAGQISTAPAPAKEAAAPPAPATAPTPAPAAAKQAIVSPAPPAPAPSAPVAPTFVRQGAKPAASAPSVSAPAAGAPVASAPAASAKAAPVRQAARRPAPKPAPAEPSITITPPTIAADALLERAFDAYQRGDLDIARQEYQGVLAREPNNRDALLGLAAIDMRARNFDTAEMRYLKLLELDPRDSHAHAGLFALQGSLDPMQSESRLKTLIARQPEATHLYFTLGNQYASQGRWVEAQEAYFKAASAEPNNPDYAFNLAVSLDQLRQGKLALENYRKALGLAARHPAAFDRAQAEARARELNR